MHAKLQGWIHGETVFPEMFQKNELHLVCMPFKRLLIICPGAVVMFVRQLKWSSIGLVTQMSQVGIQLDPI